MVPDVEKCWPADHLQSDTLDSQALIKQMLEVLEGALYAHAAEKHSQRLGSDATIEFVCRARLDSTVRERKGASGIHGFSASQVFVINNLHVDQTRECF